MYVTSYLYTNLILSFNLSICLSVRGWRFVCVNVCLCMPMCAVCTSSLCIFEYLRVCASTYLASMRLQPMYLYYACMFRCMSVTGPGCIDAWMGCLRLCVRASMQPPAWVCLCVCVHMCAGAPNGQQPNASKCTAIMYKQSQESAV